MLMADDLALIPIQEWQDPQGDVVLHHSRSTCSVYFGCWTDAGEPADYVCELQFDHAWGVRGYRLEWLPYRLGQEPTRSGIYKVENSTWLREASEQRAAFYPNWRARDQTEYCHFVVHGHDNYVEILAAGFSEKRLPYEAAGELKRLVDEG
jgi:hypothetical protein